MKVENKREMFDLLSRQAFGNSLRVWAKPDQVFESDYRGLIAIRCKIPGAGMRSHIPQDKLVNAVAGYCSDKHCGPEDIYFSEMCPPEDNRRAFSGQIMNGMGSYELEFSLGNDHLNALMRHPEFASLSMSRALLEQHLDPSDETDLRQLLEMYPDSVVEFTVSERAAGPLKRRMLIWEVRNY